MAITSTSQILSTSKVATALDYLDDAIGYLTEAKENLQTAKGYASYDNFHTNEGNPFPENTQAMVEGIDDILLSIKTLKANVRQKAATINSNEWAEYNKYQEEQKAKQNDSDSGVTTLPYENKPTDTNNYYATL